MKKLVTGWAAALFATALMANAALAETDASKLGPWYFIGIWANKAADCEGGGHLVVFYATGVFAGFEHGNVSNKGSISDLGTWELTSPDLLINLGNTNAPRESLAGRMVLKSASGDSMSGTVETPEGKRKTEGFTLVRCPG